MKEIQGKYYAITSGSERSYMKILMPFPQFRMEIK